MKKQIELALTEINDIALPYWKQSYTLYLPKSATVLAWVIRNIKTPLLVIVPDDKTKRDVVDDLKLISEKIEISDLNIVSMPDSSFNADSEEEMEKLVRGNSLLAFKQKGGILCGTPSSFILPFKLGSDFFDLRIGQEISRDMLIDTLISNGYTKTDLVWKVGQISVRGSVVDVFSPDSIYPLRIEFFDNEIESLRLFSTETQRKVIDVKQAKIQNFNREESAKLLDMLPDNLRILFVDPNKLDESAENSLWLYSSLYPTENLDVTWEDLSISLSKFPRLRITYTLYDADLVLPIWQFENFRGRLKSVEENIKFLKEKEYDITVVSEVNRILNWANTSKIPTIEATITTGFVDNFSKRAFLTDYELTGVSLKQRSEARTPTDWGNSLVIDQYVVHEDHGVAIYRGLEQVEISGNSYEYLKYILLLI